MNKVVKDHKDLLPTALEYATEIIKNSPDSVRSTKLALLLAKEMGMAESYDKHAETAIAKEVNEGENIKEGLMAFKEARMQARPIPRPAAYVPCAFYRSGNHDGRTHALSPSPPNCEGETATPGTTQLDVPETHYKTFLYVIELHYLP